MSAIIIAGTAFFALIVILPIIAIWYWDSLNSSPEHMAKMQLENKLSSQVYNHTQMLLNKNPVDCNDLHYLRQGHITYKYWYNDTLPNQKQLDEARDLWNANNCGLHWGYWEN